MTELTIKIIITLAEKISSMNVMAVSITENMYTSSQKPIQLPRAAYMETSATTLIKAGINEFCVSLNPKLGNEEGSDCAKVGRAMLGVNKALYIHNIGK